MCLATPAFWLGLGLEVVTVRERTYTGLQTLKQRIGYASKMILALAGAIDVTRKRPYIKVA
jgi:hypothetical protein